MAALTRSGARKASEIVIFTLRTLHLSRLAMLSVVAVSSAISSSSQRRPRAIDATAGANLRRGVPGFLGKDTVLRSSGRGSLRLHCSDCRRHASGVTRASRSKLANCLLRFTSGSPRVSTRATRRKKKDGPLEMRDAIGALTETWRRLGHDIGSSASGLRTASLRSALSVSRVVSTMPLLLGPGLRRSAISSPPACSIWVQGASGHPKMWEWQFVCFRVLSCPSRTKLGNGPSGCARASNIMALHQKERISDTN